MSRRNLLLMSILVPATVAGLILLFFNLPAVLSSGSQTDKAPAAILGVVDLDKLLKAHPEYKRLEQLDRTINSLQVQRNGFGGEATSEEWARIMSREQARAQAELKAEDQRLRAWLDSQQQSMGQSLKAEKERVEAGLKRLEGHPPTSSTQSAQRPPTRLETEARDLLATGEQMVAAYRLELETQARERLAREKEKNDQELATYEDDLLKQHQSAKLNLQLKLSVAETEEERNQVRAELNALSDDEQRLKAERAAELQRALESKRKEEMTRVETKVAAYRAKLTADVQRQVAAMGRGLGPDALTPDAVAQRRQLIAQFDARQRAMQAQMQACQVQAQRQLEAKARELQARLRKIEKQLAEDMLKAQRRKDLFAQQQLLELDRRIGETEKARKDLYDIIMTDLRQALDKVAQQQEITVVLGGYLVNVDCKDVTSQAEEQMATQSKPENER